MTILERIDELRLARGWSVNNLAMEAMLTQSTLNNLYSRKTDPKISTLRAICGAFGISLAEFFSAEDAQNEEDDLTEALIRKIRTLSREHKKALFQLLSFPPTA